MDHHSLLECPNVPGHEYVNITRNVRVVGARSKLAW